MIAHQMNFDAICFLFMGRLYNPRWTLGSKIEMSVGFLLAELKTSVQ